MSGTVSDPYDNSPPTDKDKNVLGLIFGDRNCVDDPITKFIWFFAFAIIATIIFWALSTPTASNYINGYVSNKYNLGIKVILFFIIILLLDWLFTTWRESHPVCK